MNTTINKVAASTGAQWILDAFAAFRANPVPFLLLASIYAVGILVASILMKTAPALGLAVLFVLTLMQPVFLGALILGQHEAQNGKRPGNNLMADVYATGKVLELLKTLLPQVTAGVLSGFLLISMVGMKNLEHTMQVMEAIQNNPQAQAELMKELPLAAYGRWAMLTLVLAIFASMFAFVAIPRILFDNRSAFQAFGDSFKAVIGNLGANVLCFVLFLITVIGILIAFMLVFSFVGVVAGRGFAEMASNFVQILVLLPLQALIIYAAWKSMFASAGNVPAIDNTHTHNFQA